MVLVNRFCRFGSLGAPLVGFFFTAAAYGQCETRKIAPSDGAAMDQFGATVDISGDFAIVGAPLHNNTVGAAYLFVRQPNGQWMEQAKLTEATIVQGQDYARTVSISTSPSGDFAAVGAAKAPRATAAAAGRVFVYRRTGTTWVNEPLATPTTILQNTEFGTSVSVDGDAVLIGAPFSDETMPTGVGNSGSAYVFRRGTNGTWTQEGPALLAQDASESDNFGSAVLLRGNTAFIAAIGDKDPNVSITNAIGAVYVFTRQVNGSWTQSQKLVPSDFAGFPGTSRLFGGALGSDGTTLIVGDRANAVQRAYVFRLSGSTWMEDPFLSKPAGDTAADQFGQSVAINGDLALVGAPADDDNALTNSGSVFVFRRVGGTWMREPLFYGSSAAANGRLGQSLASRGGTYAITGEIRTSGTGFAYILAMQPVPDCDGNSVQDECQLRANPSADGNGNGILDSCECQSNAQCNDNVACTDNVCNMTLGQCEFPVQVGFCLVAGVCQTDGAANPNNECQVCNAAANPNGWSARPDNTPCTPDANQCTRDVCIAGACAHPGEPAGTPCGNPSATVCDGADTCNGTGMCLNNFAPAGTLCPDTLFCNGGDEACNGMGACVPRIAPPCAANPVQNLCDEANMRCTQCLSDVDCPDDGNACTITSCNTLAGLCTNTNAPTGTPCGDPTVTDCNLADTCNNQGVCQANLRPNNTPCTDDGNPCNGAERCQAGVCISNNVNPCAGNPNAPNCVQTPTAPFFLCASCLADDQCNDNNECTSNACVAGACVFTPLPAGTNCGPLDQTISTCNLQDTCNGQGACLPNLAPNGTPCPDADLCNGTETCLNGLCTPGTAPCTGQLVCDPADGSCKCTTDAQCSDGLFCNGVERCVIPNGETVGTCMPAAVADPCAATPRTPACDEATDTCRCTANAQCNDSLFCTGTETCVNGACVSSGNPCTSLGLACNEGADRCDCDDNGDCDQSQFCAPMVCTGGQCVAGPPRCPTGQQCDERNNRCAVCLSSSDPVCNDNDPCTLDTCPAGQCVHTPILGCNDADRDGVSNALDRCPGTPLGAAVDANGCAAFQRDTDRDGITDDRDLCPATPVADRGDVDRNGCAPGQLDDDEDGVSNADDECPDSPVGAVVDDVGCAEEERDDDGDGVLNGDDRCPDTPANTPVDAEGCAVAQRDTDGDGVADDVDECPATPADVEVDDVGCPLEDNTNGNGNSNGNDNDNGNGNEPGQEVPDGGGIFPCGGAGLIGWFSLFTGFIALRVSRVRPRRTAP